MTTQENPQKPQYVLKESLQKKSKEIETSLYFLKKLRPNFYVLNNPNVIAIGKIT